MSALPLGYQAEEPFHMTGTMYLIDEAGDVAFRGLGHQALPPPGMGAGTGGVRTGERLRAVAP